MFEARRIRRQFEHEVGAPASAVFPLLCPVREREWVPGWEAEVVFSMSGRAEDHCVFRTGLQDPGGRTWVVSLYDPPRAIGFSIFHGDHVERLDVEVRPISSSSVSVRWTRTYTGLNDDGNRFVEAATGAELDARMGRLTTRLAQYATAPG